MPKPSTSPRISTTDLYKRRHEQSRGTASLPSAQAPSLAQLASQVYERRRRQAEASSRVVFAALATSGTGT